MEIKKKSTWANFHELVFKIKDDVLTSSELKKTAEAW